LTCIKPKPLIWIKARVTSVDQIANGIPPA